MKYQILNQNTHMHYQKWVKISSCQKVYKIPSFTKIFQRIQPSRTSGTYGAVFLVQKISSKPFTVVGDGEQTRDLHVRMWLMLC